MPFASKAQARFLHAHPEKVGGEEALKEWDAATDWTRLPMKKNWMQAESNREKHAGTKGVFKAAAQRAGQSTRDFAEEHKHSSGKIGKRARMALAFMGSR